MISRHGLFTVYITAKCLDSFLSWSASMVTARKIKEPFVFLNQAAFSFDLSVMNLYTRLFLGGTSCPLDKVGFCGLTYKENIDDVRASPILQLTESLERQENENSKASIYSIH